MQELPRSQIDKLRYRKPIWKTLRIHQVGFTNSLIIGGGYDLRERRLASGLKSYSTVGGRLV